MITSESGIRNSKFRWVSYLVPALLFISTNAYAINFSSAEVPTISNLDAVTNQWNAFGIEVADGYYYTDARDPFDQQGLAAQSGTNAANPARIDFLGGVTLGSLDIDYVILSGNVLTINVYGADDALIDTISVDAGGSIASGSISLGGPGIAYLTFHDAGGQVAISTLEFTLGESVRFFTLAILPDTQMYVEQHPEILEAQMDWIVTNQVDENIIYVAHLGDLKDDLSCDNMTVNNGVGYARTEWEIVNDAFTQLDTADIAYGVVPGNHDFEQISNTCPTNFSCAAGESETCAQRPLGIEDTTIATFNSVLGPSRFSDSSAPGYQPTYGDITGAGTSMMPQAGNRRAGTNEDNFSLVDFGGVGLVIINLGYREDTNAIASGETSVCASTTNPEISWADDLLSEYSDRLGIVTSHFFLDENSNDPGRNRFNNYGASIYTCLSDNPNLLMMLSAHRWGESWRREITGRNTDLPVHAMLSDYQRVNYLLPGGGVPSTDLDFRSLDGSNSFADGGFMRLMRFDLDTGVVTNTTFAPAVSFADPITGIPLTYPDDSASDHDGHWHVGQTGSMDRPGLESVFEPDVPVNSSTGRIRFPSGAGLHQDTASNFCFTYRGYRLGVTEPGPDGAACPITFFDP